MASSILYMEYIYNKIIRIIYFMIILLHKVFPIINSEFRI